MSFLASYGVRAGIATGLTVFIQRQEMITYLGRFISQNALRFSPTYSAISSIAYSILLSGLMNGSKNPVRHAVAQLTSWSFVTIALVYATPYLSVNLSLSILTTEQAVVSTTIALAAQIILSLFQRMINKESPIDEINRLTDEANEFLEKIEKTRTDLLAETEIQNKLIKTAESQTKVLMSNLESNKRLLEQSTWRSNIQAAASIYVTYPLKEQKTNQTLVQMEAQNKKIESIKAEHEEMLKKHKNLFDTIKQKKDHLTSLGYEIESTDD